MKYLVISSVSSGLVVGGIVVLYSEFGTTDWSILGDLYSSW